MSDPSAGRARGSGPERPTSLARPAERTFDEAEVARILEVAAKLHERDQVVPRPGRGLSLEDLREVAREAGIEPRFIDMAVSREDNPVKRSGIWGLVGPSKWQVTSEVPGELTDDDRRRLIPVLRSVMDDKGEVDEVLGRLEWRHNGDELGPVAVGIGSVDGTTEIDVSANRTGEAGLVFGLGVPMGGLLGGSVITNLLPMLDADMTLPIAVAMAGFSWLGLRVGWAIRSNWWERRIQDKTRRLSEAVRKLTDASSEAELGEGDS